MNGGGTGGRNSSYLTTRLWFHTLCDLWSTDAEQNKVSAVFHTNGEFPHQTRTVPIW